MSRRCVDLGSFPARWDAFGARRWIRRRLGGNATALAVSFSGGEPVKISQEIQRRGNQINWQYGQTLWVTVDTRERRIYVGAPFGSATSQNRVLMLDYHDLDSASDIEGRPPVIY